MDNISKVKIVNDGMNLEARIVEIAAEIKAAEEAFSSARSNIEQLTIERYRLEGEHRAVSRMRATLEPVTEKEIIK